MMVKFESLNILRLMIDIAKVKFLLTDGVFPIHCNFLYYENRSFAQNFQMFIYCLDFLSKFPEPPTDLPSVGNADDVSRNKPGVDGKNDNDELDFDELARRFNELKKKY